MTGDLAKALTLTLAVAAVSGCVPGAPPLGPPEQVIPPMGDDCGVARLGGHIGRDLASLAGIPLPGDLRAIRPGQEVTRDLSPTRLNVQLDAGGRILRLFCG